MYSLKLPACQNIDKYQWIPLTQDLRSACLTLPSTQKRCGLTSQLLIFDASTPVFVWPIGIDMVEVASSNLAGPTKYDRPGLVPGFSYLA